MAIFGNEMPAIRLVAIDIDGTLLDDGGEVSPRTRAAVCDAVSAGLVIVPATGRRYRTTLPIAQDLGLRSYAVCQHGTVVKDLSSDETVYIRALSAATAGLAAKKFSEAGFEPIYFVDGYGEGVDFLLDALPERAGTQDYVGRSDGLWRLREERPGMEVIEVAAFDEEERLLALEKDLARTLGGKATFHTMRTPSYSHPCLEVTNRDAGKGRALLHLAERLGISRGETAAIGNGRNDLNMFEAAGVSFAVANSSDTVRSAADFVVASSNEDGVAEALTRILEASEGRPGGAVT